jgi:glycosyltransferase involved in cell wall biosynthesis
MKFSILLPTRNRLEYLKLAVESVMRQDTRDWQLVISDNCSEQDVEGYVASLGDPRILYRRTERVVPVTENWNRALAYSEGDYIIMLGDDDALLGGYLRRMETLIRDFQEPDVIYAKALLFTYPGVDPEHPAGFLMDHGFAAFFAGASRPFVLERERALEVVRAAMSFRLRYDFNAQFALISRRLIESLSEYGDFYQSAFPDYYSMNASFLRAKRIVVEPEPSVVIGVTPKSYGYFHVNRMEAEGRNFLHGAGSGAVVGTNINVGWLSAARALERGVAAEFGLSVNYRRYRFVQAAHVYASHRKEMEDKEELRALDRDLPLAERWGYRCASAALRLVHGMLPQKLKVAMVRLALRVVGQVPEIAPTIVEGRYGDVLDIYRDRAEVSSMRSAQTVGGQ